MEKLIGNLRKQKDHYLMLIDQAERKQRAIIDNKLEDIEKINIEEERTVMHLSKLENERIAYLGSKPSLFGADATSISLEEVMERFPQGARLLMEKETTSLMKVLSQLKAINAENAQLLQQALRFVNVTINTITGVEADKSYTKEKSKDSGPVKAPNILDRKI